MRDILPVKVLAPAEFLKVIADPKVPVIDVRTPIEYAMGHFERAINVDICSEDFVEKIDALNLDKSAPIALYCHSGIRSHNAAEVLPWLGFTGQIYDLEGGYGCLQG